VVVVVLGAVGVVHPKQRIRGAYQMATVPPVPFLKKVREDILVIRYKDINIWTAIRIPYVSTRFYL
jgi:hypothetical protein